MFFEHFQLIFVNPGVEVFPGIESLEDPNLVTFLQLCDNFSLSRSDNLFLSFARLSPFA